MIFAVPKHIEEIFEGRKTQTRRRWQDGDVLVAAEYDVPTQLFRKDKLKYQVGGVYSIQPGRGKKGVGHIEIIDIRKEKVSDISESDAIAEGGYTCQEYLDLWRKMYKVDPQQDWCWVISFKVVEKEKQG